MGTIKQVESILNPPPFHWVGNGFKVHNYFPRGIHSDTRMSPFFLLDYNAKMHYPPSSEKRGVGVHPHRGLETVTIAYHGKVAHHDSAGHGGIISEGDVQWMTAGKAILHKEYHHQSYVEKGGDFQMVQLWINLPAAHKMTEPRYQEIPHSKMGKYVLNNNEGVVNVIAGSFKDIKGAAKTFTDVNLFDIRLEKGSVFTMSLKQDHNTAILVVEGSICLNEKHKAHTDQLALFENNGTDIKIESLEKSVILLMSGEPIEEPIYPYGPFLMNTKEEILQAYEDFNNGNFGYLED
ncbi:MAG: pirin family protein [Bacteroidales bacterium]|nr:pirin family protein [Bacteroidales bacterium]